MSNNSFDFSPDNKVNLEVKEPRHPISESLSESQQYNILSNEEKTLNRQNFVTLGHIPEEDKIEILKTGFRLNQEGKIALKKYYETKDQYSLFQLKGYSIKYESIRRTKLYQQLNPSNN